MNLVVIVITEKKQHPFVTFVKTEIIQTKMTVMGVLPSLNNESIEDIENLINALYNKQHQKGPF